MREVDEVAGTSTIKFLFKREWHDQRLLFHGEEGEMSPEEKDKIWLPWTIISNLRDKNGWIDTDKKDLYSFKVRNGYKPNKETTHNGSNIVIGYEREKSLCSCATLICFGILSTRNPAERDSTKEMQISSLSQSQLRTKVQKNWNSIL